MQLRREGWIEENKQKIGFNITVRCRKSKVGGDPYQECTIPFRLDGGIDVVETVIREGLDKGLIQQAGPWYKWDKEKLMGMNNVRKFFTNDDQALAMLKEKLLITGVHDDAASKGLHTTGADSS